MNASTNCYPGKPPGKDRGENASPSSHNRQGMNDYT